MSSRLFRRRIAAVASALVLAQVILPLRAPAAEQKFLTFHKSNSLAPEFRSASLISNAHPAFTVVSRDAVNVLTEMAPAPKDVLYFQTPEPMASIDESYAFEYTGPSSVVEPIIVDAAPSVNGGIQGFETNLTPSSPHDKNAGDESFVYMTADGKPETAIRGRLRTEPYQYRLGHRYRVEIVADSQSHVLTTRIYDEQFGPQTFDRSIKTVSATFKGYPGIVNRAGGQIAVFDFAFGPAGQSPLRPHVARRASDYMNYLGFNAAVTTPETSVISRAFQRYFPALLVKHVRVPAEPRYLPGINSVARYGIDADVLTGTTTTLSGLQHFVSALSRPPDSFELWNEPNNIYGAYDAHFESDLVPFARELRAAYPKATIWGPSILPDANGYPSIEKDLAPTLGGLIDGWNTHSYTRGTPENTGYGGFFAGACGGTHSEDCGWYGAPNWNDNNSAVINPNLPGVSTEGAASYGTYPEICGAALVDFATQQAYVQRGMLYNFKLGHLRVYPYKFIDDGGCSDGFGTFGIMSLLRNPDHTVATVTPKPAYTALVYLDHLLADPGPAGNAFEPRSLTFRLGGETPDVESLLLQESDGTYRLVLWSDAQLWDFNANGPKRIGAPVPVVSDHVSLELESPAGLTTYEQRPGLGTWAIRKRTIGPNINVDVNQFPVVVVIAPQAHVPPEIALPQDVAPPGPVETPKPGSPRRL